jgi:hypothetical protein
LKGLVRNDLARIPQITRIFGEQFWRRSDEHLIRALCQSARVRIVRLQNPVQPGLGGIHPERIGEKIAPQLRRSHFRKVTCIGRAKTADNQGQ